MKYLLLSLLLQAGILNFIYAQQDTSVLFREAEGILEKKQGKVSDILSNDKYLVLHPQTSFRNLIKKYSTTDILTIITPKEPGKKIQVKVLVTDEAGKPLPGAAIYLYQTDSRGWYAADQPHVLMNEGDMRHARLFGYVQTDSKGSFELRTVKPSGYPKSDLPAHIHIHVEVPGYRGFISELLFDDDERLVGEIRNRSTREGFLVAKPATAPQPFAQLFNYTIKLQKQ